MIDVTTTTYLRSPRKKVKPRHEVDYNALVVECEERLMGLLR